MLNYIQENEHDRKITISMLSYTNCIPWLGKEKSRLGTSTEAKEPLEYYQQFSTNVKPHIYYPLYRGKKKRMDRNNKNNKKRIRLKSRSVM